jgi:hypothetical protein
MNVDRHLPQRALFGCLIQEGYNATALMGESGKHFLVMQVAL